MESLAPTRMNLLARRGQIRLARDGVGMLKGKREALLKELIARARELKVLRRELHRRGRIAVASLAMARAVSGTPQLRSTALAGRRTVRAKVHYKNVWGLKLAGVDCEALVRTYSQRGVGCLDTCSHAFEAGEAAEHMLEQLIACVPVEHNLRRLGEEVRKVSRRINALEEYLLPRLRHDVRRITRVLDEREREDVFRLKRIKKKLKKAGTKRGEARDEANDDLCC